MGLIIDLIESYSGGKCYYSDRYTLDHRIPPEYQDIGEEFNSNIVFEDDNPSGKKLKTILLKSPVSIFRFFLDGSRRTYKIVDFASTDNKFLPIIAGQIGTGICQRKQGKLKKYKIVTQNVLTVPDRIGGQMDELAKELSKTTVHGIKIDRVLKYQYSKNPDRPFENLAIAKIQFEMLKMEIDLVSEMVNSKDLSTDKMLIIDGSLQHSGINEKNEYIFENVIGISKNFNPHLDNLLKTKRKEIGNYLTELQYGERTPVYKYDAQKKGRSISIGAWYLRIRQKKYSKNPLDGVIKIEKMATTQKEKASGLSTDLVDEISSAIIAERNVTCYGKDDRWANHIYPIFLTEQYLKSNFVSDNFFLNIF
ncbi:MAG: hypothetical protein JW866_05580 [Ignavibacteriales bacterium]|nr:hypothetical protein [Ignavibacteriales bacterium]